MSGVLAIMEADAVQPHVRLVREDIGLAYMLARVLGVEAAHQLPARARAPGFPRSDQRKWIRAVRCARGRTRRLGARARDWRLVGKPGAQRSHDQHDATSELDGTTSC